MRRSRHSLKAVSAIASNATDRRDWINLVLPLIVRPGRKLCQSDVRRFSTGKRRKIPRPVRLAKVAIFLLPVVQPVTVAAYKLSCTRIYVHSLPLYFAFHNNTAEPTNRTALPNAHETYSRTSGFQIKKDIWLFKYRNFRLTKPLCHFVQIV